ncbi:MAG: hypothetical protein JWL90_876, partial [Chthoniobacteraceae bacterium]|nr:hypothetical protein [Chthoniobacteraceae bacterium]
PWKAIAFFHSEALQLHCNIANKRNTRATPRKKRVILGKVGANPGSL